MRRISTIRTSREASVEERREELRNSRWARHRSQILTFATLLLLAVSAAREAFLPELLRLIERLIGL